MPVKICDNCLQYFSVNDYDSDSVHRCNSGSLALDQEDRFILGKFTGERNEPGEGVVQDVQREPSLQGIQNKLQGTFAGIQGERVTSFTIRGNKAVYMRARQHYHYSNNLLQASSTKMEGVGIDYGRRI